ncbi:MAG: hypothetical protein OXJ54_07355 [Gemmatimonadetes bacterium]|nr:hypothetical protein [Candidatus Palauibacter rhopaloidicola]
MRRLAFTLTVAVAACYSTGPELENPPPNAAGEWSLATVDGVRLPAPAMIRGAAVSVVSSRLQMDRRSRWTGALEYDDGEARDVIEFRGDWSQAGDRVTLAQDEGCTDTATVTEGELRIADDCDFGLDLMFVRAGR